MQHGQWRRPSSGAAILALAAWLGFGTRGAHADELTFSLAASPDASFSISDSAFGVFLDLELVLDPSATDAVGVTTFPYGAVRVRHVLRNGVTIKPFKERILFEENPSLLQVEEFTALAPGGMVNIPYDVVIDEGVGVQLRSVRLGRKKHKLLVYPLSGPAAYTVQLAYQFKRINDPDLPPVPTSPPVVTREILSNEASFTLVP